MTEIGKKFREIRKSLNMTQKEFSEMLGLKSAQAVQGYELGLSKPPYEIIKRLLENVDVSPNELFDEVDNGKIVWTAVSKKKFILPSERAGEVELAVQISFENGACYEYPRIPVSVYDGFANTPPKAKVKYYKERIKGKFYGYRIPSPIDEENKTPYSPNASTSDDLVKYV